MNLLTTFYLEFLHMVSYACASCTQSAVNILRVVQGTIILLSYSLSLSLSLSLYIWYAAYSHVMPVLRAQYFKL